MPPSESTPNVQHGLVAIELAPQLLTGSKRPEVEGKRGYWSMLREELAEKPRILFITRQSLIDNPGPYPIPEGLMEAIDAYDMESECLLMIAEKGITSFIKVPFDSPSIRFLSIKF